VIRRREARGPTRFSCRGHGAPATAPHRADPVWGSGTSVRNSVCSVRPIFFRKGGWMGASLIIGGWETAAPLRERVGFEASATGGDGGRILARSFRDPSGKLAGTFRDGSGTIRGGFEGVLAAEAASDQTGGPGDGAEPCEGRARPEGTVAGSFREAGRNLPGRFGDGSRTIRGGFEGVWAAEAASDPAGDPGDGAEPGEGRARPVGTVAGSFGEAGRNLQGRFGDDSRTVRGGFEGVLAAEAASGRAGRPRRWRRAGRGASAAGGDGGRILRGSWPEPSGTVRGRFEDDSRWVRGRLGGGSGVRPRR
jgi:hypothetical protein